MNRPHGTHPPHGIGTRPELGLWSSNTLTTVSVQLEAHKDWLVVLFEHHEARHCGNRNHKDRPCCLRKLVVFGHHKDSTTRIAVMVLEYQHDHRTTQTVLMVLEYPQN